MVSLSYAALKCCLDAIYTAHVLEYTIPVLGCFERHILKSSSRLTFKPRRLLTRPEKFCKKIRYIRFIQTMAN